MKAYVLINVQAGTARAVVTKLKQLKGVKSAHACWGRPDVFSFVEVKDERALADTVLAKIQLIDGVEATDTHIAIES